MTTRPTPGPPWDDERLAAAFAARAARRGTPEGLANATSAALRTRPTSAVALRRLLAPAAVVILAVGAVSGGLALRDTSGVDEPPGGQTPDSSVFPFASDAAGLPVISVTDAIAIRDAGIDDREIAVRGWLAPVVPVPCPVPLTPATSPVQPVCPDDQGILMAEPESLVTSEPNGLSRRSPTGPYFQISLDFQIHLDDLDGGWQAGVPNTAAMAPVEIVVVGHFDDRRSSSCPADTQAACRDRFIVDRVDRVNGHLQPTSVLVLHKGAGSPFDDAKHIIDAVRPGVAVLSAVHVDSAGLRHLEPALADHGGGLNQESATWVVRVLDREALATYLIVDSTGSIYELTANGPVLIALSTPGERASPEPSPISDIP